MDSTSQNAAQSGGYHQAGNLTFHGVNTYAYDGEGRMCAVRSDPIPGTYTKWGYLYDADGNRVAKGTITAMSCNPGSNGFVLSESYVLGPSGETAPCCLSSDTQAWCGHPPKIPVRRCAMKPPLRIKSVSTKVSEEEFAELESRARARKLTLSEWVRAELLEPRGGESGAGTEVLLGEVLALRTILIISCSLRQSSSSNLPQHSSQPAACLPGKPGKAFTITADFYAATVLRLRADGCLRLCSFVLHPWLGTRRGPPLPAHRLACLGLGRGAPCQC